MSSPYFQTVLNNTIPSIYRYPPAIIVKSAAWYHHDADLFIITRGTVYGVYQQHFRVSPYFRQIFSRNEPGHDISRGTTCWLPIPFDDLDPFVFIKFLVCLYSPNDYDGNKNDFKDIQRLSLVWKFPELAGLALQKLLGIRQKKLSLTYRKLCATSTVTSWIMDEMEHRRRTRNANETSELEEQVRWDEHS
jgi:hypothetical protein